jgi:hypothetical protein
MIIFKFFVVVIFVGTVSGHARLALPPSRSSAWQFGFSTPINYNDWQLNCGGYQVSEVILFKLIFVFDLL